MLAGADAGARQLLGVGIGVPGIVEQRAEGGAVVHGQTIGWDAVPLERCCGAALRRSPAPVPLHIDNGAKTLGQAEMWFGAGRGTRDAVIALIGSGVGACVVTGGEPYGGAASSAGEWGHTVLTVGGRRCRCGALGCLEAYVGAGAVLERWREAGGDPAVRTRSRRSPNCWPRRARAEPKHDRAHGVLAETAEYLGAGIADLVNLFNPELILLGGWAGLLLGPRLLPALREVTDAYALRYPAARTVIEVGRLGPDAVTVGAATLPLRRFLDAGGSAPPGVALSA